MNDKTNQKSSYDLREIPANTSRFEHIHSAVCKEITSASSELCAIALVKSKEFVETDPLSAEKFIHLADQLCLIAYRMYDMGEKARTVAGQLEVIEHERT